MNFEEFIHTHTAVETTQLVPEVRLRLATEITPLWHATEAYLQQCGIEPPFWAFAWVGGQALARYILDHREIVAGMHVVDIGSGGGIVSIAAVLGGAKLVTALDVDPIAAAACRMNAQLNGIAGRIATVTARATEYELAPYDVVLAGDVCYMRGDSDDVVRHLRAAAAPVLIGDPGRQFLPREGMRLLATYDVATSRELEADSLTQAGVWRMTGREP